MQFCDAIMNNDTITMRRLANDGVDVNMELGLWFEQTMLRVWKTRCRAEINGRIVSTPCFMCGHKDPKHRPTSLALAVMFNAQGCLTDLLFMGAHPIMQVWFGEVMESGNRLVVNEEAEKARLDSHGLAFYYLQQLPQAMFDRNVHRLTGGYVEAKTQGWKEICKDALSDLDMIVKGDFTKVRQIQIQRASLAEEKRIAAEELAAKKVEAAHAAREQREGAERAEQDAALAAEHAEKTKNTPSADAGAILRRRKKEEAEALEQQRLEHEAEIKRKANIVEGDADFLKMLAEQEAEDQFKEMMEQQRIENENMAHAASEERAVFKVCAFVVDTMFKEDMRPLAEEAIFEETPVPYKKPGRQPLVILPDKPTPYGWRDHSMVLKLNSSAPIVVTVSAPADYAFRADNPPDSHSASRRPSVLADEKSESKGNSDKEKNAEYKNDRNDRVKQAEAGDQVYMLGKRSFWNESRAFTLSDTIKREQEARELHERRRKADRIYNMTATRIARQRGQKLSEELKPLSSLDERKKNFHALVQYDFKRKFLVRGEIEEPEPEEEDPVSEGEEQDPATYVFDDGSGGSYPSSPSASSPSQTPIENRSIAGSPTSGNPESPRIFQSIQMMPTLARIDSVPLGSENSVDGSLEASLTSSHRRSQVVPTASVPSALLLATPTVVPIAAPAMVPSENKEAWSSNNSVAPASSDNVIVTPVNGSTDPSPRDETPSTKVIQGAGISPALHSEPA